MRGYRLKAQTTSKKLRCWSLLLRPKQPVEFALLTYVPHQDQALWIQPRDHILRKLHGVSFSVLEKCVMSIFIFNSLLKLQDNVTFKA